ncbi:MAG: glycoside hydrolase family 75 protein [Candidatus Nitrotoga sp.]|nr:glycoside hydrolase family 75 protein [Candidatus Nitrotoga sp.]
MQDNKTYQAVGRAHFFYTNLQEACSEAYTEKSRKYSSEVQCSKVFGVIRHYFCFALVFFFLSSSAVANCTLVKELTFSHDEIGAIQILRDPQSKAIAFASQMQVNTDGAPDSYHPDDIGITHICNGISVGQDCTWKPKCLPDFEQAKAEGFGGPTKICFFAMATNAQGLPIIQGTADPNPGYFVSTTALQQPGENRLTPQAQLNSNTIPFAVIPRTWQRSGKPGPQLGDFGVAYRRSNGKAAFFVIGDIGPSKKLGEGSVALHQALGNDPFMTRFGVRRARKGIGGHDVVYLMFPDSAQTDQKFSAAMIEQLADERLRAFGGIERLKACADSIGK